MPFWNERFCGFECVADVADVADPLQTNTTILPETDSLLLTSALEDATGKLFEVFPLLE